MIFAPAHLGKGEKPIIQQKEKLPPISRQTELMTAAKLKEKTFF